VNFGFGQTSGSSALGDGQRFHYRCWIGLEESLALRPPAKTTDSLQTLIDRAIGQEKARGYCVHPDAGPGTCSGGPTDAHIIQKEGGLRANAENGHVISSKKGAFSIARNDGRIIPQRDGGVTGTLL